MYTVDSYDSKYINLSTHRYNLQVPVDDFKAFAGGVKNYGVTAEEKDKFISVVQPERYQNVIETETKPLATINQLIAEEKEKDDELYDEAMIADLHWQEPYDDIEMAYEELDYRKMKKLFIVVNECYGGFPAYGLNRQYNSVKEFKDAMTKLVNLTSTEIATKYNGWHPLMCSNPVLYEIELADDEAYEIDEYDGYESLNIFKKAEIQSEVVAKHGFDLSAIDE